MEQFLAAALCFGLNWKVGLGCSLNAVLCPNWGLSLPLSTEKDGEGDTGDCKMRYDICQQVPMQSSRAAIYHIRASRLVKPFLLGLLCDGRLGPASLSLQPQSGCQSSALTAGPHTRQHTFLTEAQSKVGTGILC